MNRYGSITLIAKALLLSAIVLFAGNSKSYAQESDIKAAVGSFHAALSSLDLKKVDAVWAHEGYVTLINPRDKKISIGWEAVKANWEATVNFWSELKLTQVDGPHIHISGNVAWATGIANAAGKSKAGAAVSADTYETDVFEKRGNQWLLVSHTASRVPQ
jgi:ketosteroid isomerase-like protein